MKDLARQHCLPSRSTDIALDQAHAHALLGGRWALNADATAIGCDFDFKNFHRTMEFVNAVAWIAHREDHHPDLHVSYQHCRVVYSTHSIGGLSLNDFICAAKIDDLLA